MTKRARSSLRVYYRMWKELILCRVNMEGRSVVANLLLVPEHISQCATQEPVEGRFSMK